jgi:hypothetical protein
VRSCRRRRCSRVSRHSQEEPGTANPLAWLLAQRGLLPVFGYNPLRESGAKRTLLEYLVPGGERQRRIASDIASRNVMVWLGEGSETNTWRSVGVTDWLRLCSEFSEFAPVGLWGGSCRAMPRMPRDGVEDPVSDGFLSDLNAEMAVSDTLGGKIRQNGNSQTGMGRSTRLTWLLPPL